MYIKGMQLPKTRAEAKALGLPRYFTGKSCKHRHVAERKTASGNCFECDHARYRANRSYYANKHKEWVEANPERDRKNKQEYQKKHPEKRRESGIEWRQNNPTRRRELDIRWKLQNPEKARDSWRRANKKRRALYPHLKRAERALRRSRQRRATPKWTTKNQIKQMEMFYQQAVLCEQLTGVEHHVDHIEPITGKDRCGLHVPWNLQVMTAFENLSKNNRT